MTNELRCAVCREGQAEVLDNAGLVVAYVPFTLTVAGWTCSGCTEHLRDIDRRFVERLPTLHRSSCEPR